MLSARFIVRPDKYFLYFDKPAASGKPQWSCACAIAKCVQRQPSVGVPFRRGRRVKMGHWPELMRYDVLLEHGGIFLDHDSYALKPLDDVRRCCGRAGGEGEVPRKAGDASSSAWRGSGSCTKPAAVIAGFEQEESGRKLNPGTLMTEANAEFLQLWRASWFNYSARDWDYNCCQVSYRLHKEVGESLRSHLRADLGPLPRYATEREYDAHLARARVVHVTALSQPWRRRDSRRFGIMEKVSRLVLRRVNASRNDMSVKLRRCVEMTAVHMQRRHARPGQKIFGHA